MKLTHEGIFNANITSQRWEVSPSGLPICKMGFQTDSGDITGSFFFDENVPKFGTETGLEKNSRAFAAAIPGWTPSVMDREQTYIGAKVVIQAKENKSRYLNVSGIFPLGYEGGGQKLDTNGDAMARIRAAAAVAAQGVTPAAEQPKTSIASTANDFADNDSVPW